MKKRCLEQKERLEQASNIVLRTGKGYELTIFYRGRQWNIDAGEGDMPCGEVYIAPIEEETEGEVYFEKLYLEDLGVYEDVVFSIRKGIIEYSAHSEINEFLRNMELYDKTVCELGFGMNEHVAELCGYPVLDEKMKNSFHIAIGDNTMFGGENQADIHIDFVGKAEIEMIKE